MTIFRKTAVFGALLLFGAAGCADLEVTNPNEADRAKAIRTPGDVQSLISGSFQSWYNATNHATNSPSLLLSHQAFQHSSNAANFGMLAYPALPRFAVNNTVTHQDYVQIANSWTVNYRALAAIADGLRAINADTAVRAGLGTANVARARAFGKFVQGLSHASLALMYDRGYVVDETITTIDEEGMPVLLGEPVPSAQLMTAALGYLDQAIAASTGQTWTIPATWMSVDVSAANLARLARSMKAQFRAANARNPQQRAAVNWAAVKADIDAGLTTTFNVDQSYIYNNWLGGQYNSLYIYFNTFSRANYMIHGMADQSGRYQNWLARPVPDRHPNQAGPPPNGQDPFLIITPDKRFPQGATAAAQLAAPGTKIYHNNGGLWSQGGRGTWRWSYYNPVQTNAAVYPRSAEPFISKAEMDLLKAEAHFRLGELPEAVAIINTYRTAAGLNATDASGLNTSCVPKLPSGACGNLFEMLKWEKRMETMFQGPFMAGWYFDSRGWGDLYKGTQLEFPIPEQEYITLGLGTPYTFGGSQPSSSPGSNYKWPHE
jgi:hypothetical protein